LYNKLFLMESSGFRSRLLITTREESIAVRFGAREFTTNLLTETQSRQVLSKWSGVPVNKLPPQAAELIRKCGYLPLAIAMIGGQLRGGSADLWKSAIEPLRKTNLQAIRAQFSGPHTTLLRAIQVSVDALDPSYRERYIALAVLLEDMAAAVPVQQCLWGVDKNEAEKTAERFVSLSLAQRDRRNGALLLHDVQLDFVRKQYPHPKALSLLRRTIALSAETIREDPRQFPSQVVGRLMLYRHIPAINLFVQRAIAGARTWWLRPLQPILRPPRKVTARRLKGHKARVNAVVVTRDGQRAISASKDKTLKVWRLPEGDKLHTLKGHKRAVKAAAVTPDGQRVISACADKTLKVWSLADGEELRTIKGHKGSVNAVAVTPDGQHIVSVSSDNTVRVWRLKGGRELRVFKGRFPSSGFCSLAITADGRHAVTGSYGPPNKTWDVESGVLAVWDLKGHSRRSTTVDYTDARISGLALTPDGKRVVASSGYSSASVWDLENKRELRTLRGEAESVKAVTVTGDGKWAILAPHNHALKVWDLKTGKTLTAFRGDTLPSCCAISDPLKLIVMGDIDGHVTFLQLEDPKSRQAKWMSD
jgi:hypothetical protein